MARVTVEDCITIVPNRFDLVMVAAHRARQLSSGAALTIDRDRDKNPVVALREVAEKTVDPEALQESLIRGHQRITQSDEPEEEIVELMAGEQGWAGAAHAEDVSTMFSDDADTGSSAGNEDDADSDDVADDEAL